MSFLSYVYDYTSSCIIRRFLLWTSSDVICAHLDSGTSYFDPSTNSSSYRINGLGHITGPKCVNWIVFDILSDIFVYTLSFWFLLYFPFHRYVYGAFGYELVWWRSLCFVLTCLLVVDRHDLRLPASLCSQVKQPQSL